MTPEEAYAEVQKGFEAYGQKQFQAAEKIADDVLAQAANDPNGLYLKAICRRVNKDFETALMLLDKVNSSVPGIMSFQLARVQILADTQQYEQAISGYRQLMSDFPDEVTPRLRLAELLFQLNRMEEAKQAIDAGFFLQPDNPDLHLLCAMICDSEQDVKGMMAHADAALKHKPDWYEAILLRARGDLLQQDFHSAIKRLNKVAPPTKFEICERSALIGDAYHQLRDYTSAYKAWIQGNDTARKYFQEVYADNQSAISLNGVKRARELFKKQRSLPPATTEIADPKAPIFILGFPRSGSSLIKQILVAHPQVQGYDERNCLLPIILEYGQSEASFERFYALDESQLDELRSGYWERVRQGGVDPDKGLFIDMSPINLTWIGFIGRLFPKAVVILSVRDPRDAVLSAFQRNFDINAATYHMLSMTDAAEYYDASHEAAFAGIQSSSSLKVLLVKYEQMLLDFEQHVIKLFDMLGIPIDPSAFEDRDSIAAGDTSKPSVNLVNQLLYESSVGKWKHYAHAIRPVMHNLTPWIQQHGYEEEDDF